MALWINFPAPLYEHPYEKTTIYSKRTASPPVEDLILVTSKFESRDEMLEVNGHYKGSGDK
jgi:hypothetical protein